MSKTYEFLKDCKVFFLLTSFNDTPFGRPFGAIMQFEDHLYISTAKIKNVYKQLINNPKVQIIALQPNSRKWIRVSALALECHDLKIKELMLKENPNVARHFLNASDPNFSLFELKNVSSFINTDSSSIKID